MSLTADKPAILKTDSDFKGIVYRGVDDGFDWSYIKSHLTGGRLPRISSDALNEVVISKTIANQLGLKVGDKILTYFIDSKVKVRNPHIVGIFNTDFDHFDKQVMMGNIALIQQVNGWNSYVGNYVGIDMANTGTVREESYSLFKTLALWTYEKGGDTLYNVTNTQDNNKSFFTWLGMLNMNVAIILILMMVVSGFTLVSALLMIVLERIRLVGLLKAMGATNGSVRRIFIYLTQKLIIKALIAGNAVGLGLALLQQNFHIVRLNPEAYYMPYVPIEINATSLVALNVAIVVISYITLLGPSYIVSSIKPTSTMKFE
ncbi:MAG: ABC transporter permease, partial [Bacteroidales bacterium]|nr:ABC transporter permease [Bacteroidales bacterium]